MQTNSGYAFALLHSMTKTSDGGFALAGAMETSEDAEDFLIVKVDSQGNELWSKTYNSGTYPDSSGELPRYDEATAVIQTRDGGYAILGQTTTYARAPAKCSSLFEAHVGYPHFPL